MVCRLVMSHILTLREVELKTAIVIQASVKPVTVSPATLNHIAQNNTQPITLALPQHSHTAFVCTYPCLSRAD